ncbi:hypothetical protein RhiirA4_468494 [Rhizophagus irregularis]|uniref:CCHC-type domain-containing protein n=1 Tax=Rhizophagus irregularis TaxID=588596 RepID=A0A2I1GXV1_9GLOM|nr:hypothetical protein RhiirA4_468494 [Rhizophagus irregularis]
MVTFWKEIICCRWPSLLPVYPTIFKSTKPAESANGENQQDSVTWLRDYNAASVANGWNNVQKLKVVPAYLRSTAAEWYQSLKQDNLGFVTTWVAEQRVQGSDETVEHYVSVLQKLFTRVEGYNKAQKTQKVKRCEMTLMAGKNKNVSNYGNSAQLETIQLTQMMMELSNNSPTGGNRSLIVCYICGEPGHISRTCLQRNNNRSGNGGVAATVLNQQSQQPQPAQSTQTLNANSANNLNSNNNDLIALLVQQLLAQKSANSTTGGSLN